MTDRIIDFIPYDHYVTREELVNLTGFSDREVRRRINKIRTTSPETVIISSSTQKGYKRPSTYKELENCLKESRARVRQEFAKQRQLLILLRNKDQRGLGV